jgi:RimJ/RimL family protein N-acetyltransferase
VVIILLNMNQKNLTNELGQSIGEPVEGWKICETPPKTQIEGKYCVVEILDVKKHAEDLFNSYVKDVKNYDWTYLHYGGFKSLTKFKEWLDKDCLHDDPLFYAIIDKNQNLAVGMASYLRIQQKIGSIEVGHIHYSPPMQQKPIGTEVMYLMMKRVFDELGYRRYEWKCDSLNERSCKAAKRYGFTFEGIFRQHNIVKGHNRDTAWFSIIDKDWGRIKKNYETWLDKTNFDREGRQKTSLTSLMLGT